MAIDVNATQTYVVELRRVRTHIEYVNLLTEAASEDEAREKVERMLRSEEINQEYLAWRNPGGGWSDDDETEVWDVEIAEIGENCMDFNKRV